MEQPTAAERIRAQAKEATRRALLEAGLAETIDRGGEIPTIETLCARAGYTRGAFYVYFKDREHFINEMFHWLLTDVMHTIFLTATEDAVDVQDVIVRFNDALVRGEWPDLHNNIRAVYLAILRELKPGSSVLEKHAELMQDIADHLERLIRSGQKAGRIRKDAKAREVAVLFQLTAVGAIMWDRVGIAMDGNAIGASLVKLLDPAAVTSKQAAT